MSLSNVAGRYLVISSCITSTHFCLCNVFRYVYIQEYLIRKKKINISIYILLLISDVVAKYVDNGNQYNVLLVLIK